MLLLHLLIRGTPALLGVGLSFDTMVLLATVLLMPSRWNLAEITAENLLTGVRRKETP